MDDAWRSRYKCKVFSMSLNVGVLRHLDMKIQVEAGVTQNQVEVCHPFN
jgi:hypothetical protein